MNVFCFTGNLGGDAETRYTPSGQSVANFSVAVKSGYGQHEKTHWVGCQLWGKRAEGGLIQYLRKGQPVAVSGELSVREYDRKDGSKGFALEVRVSDVTLMGSQDGGAQNAGHAPQAQQQRAPAPQQQQAEYADFDSEIPF